MTFNGNTNGKRFTYNTFKYSVSISTKTSRFGKVMRKSTCLPSLVPIAVNLGPNFDYGWFPTGHAGASGQHPHRPCIAISGDKRQGRSTTWKPCPNWQSPEPFCRKRGKVLLTMAFSTSRNKLSITANIRYQVQGRCLMPDFRLTRDHSRKRQRRFVSYSEGSSGRLQPAGTGGHCTRHDIN